MTKKDNVKIKLPENVEFIINTLNEAGYEAFAVGGCIRDSIIGRTPDDWDITTEAFPEEVKKCFKKTVDTGIEHGTVTVILKNREKRKDAYSGGKGGAKGECGSEKPEKDRGELTGYEVTTYRVDGVYKDGRHPEKVTYTPSLKEDLRRRDFTVNAMAYNDRSGLTDEFGGMEDLEKKIIRCVGEPDERFDEDALRILRAVRFAAQLGFSVEKRTEKAAAGHAENLKNVSKERIQTELTKLLCSKNPGRASDIRRLGMSPYICPEFKNIRWEYFEEACARLAFESVSAKEKYKRYALLLLGMEKSGAQKLLRELKLDNETVKNTALLSEFILEPAKAEPYSIKKVMQKTGRELYGELLNMKKALKDCGAGFYSEKCSAEDTERVIYISEKITEENEPLFISELSVTGRDLISVGVEQGPKMGELLSQMLEEVLRNPHNNEKGFLISRFVKPNKAGEEQIQKRL